MVKLDKSEDTVVKSPDQVLLLSVAIPNTTNDGFEYLKRLLDSTQVSIFLVTSWPSPNYFIGPIFKN